MAQSRIEELEQEVKRLEKELELREDSIRNQVDEIERLEKEIEEKDGEIYDLEEEIKELEDEECDCDHQDGEVYSICYERIFVASEEPIGSLSIPMQDLFNALAEKSKQFAGPNQFIEAIESL